jgi:hypothetical protein
VVLAVRSEELVKLSIFCYSYVENSIKSNKNRVYRKALLARLVSNINNGEFSNMSYNPKQDEKYKSPAERSNYNYGYMTSSEMEAGTPNV